VESRFSAPVKNDTLYNQYHIFPGDAIAGIWRLTPSMSKAEVKVTVEL
jgi:hypothetical protein